MKNKLFLLTIFLISTIMVSAQTKDRVQHFSFDKLPAKQIDELLSRKMISGKDGTIGYFTYKKGAVVPPHHHSNEQYSLIIKGSVKVLVNGREFIVKAGEGIIIPSNAVHSFTALEDDTIDIDFFAPRREDWINNTDNYYKKK